MADPKKPPPAITWGEIDKMMQRGWKGDAAEKKDATEGKHDAAGGAGFESIDDGRDLKD